MSGPPSVAVAVAQVGQHSTLTVVRLGDLQGQRHFGSAATWYTVDVSERTDVETLVRSSSLFAGETVHLRPLHGGITNHNHVVTSADRQYVVRIPGERTELLGINRTHEAEATHRAAELGIGPPVLGLLEPVGTLVTEFVEGEHLDSASFATRLGDVVELIQRFHRSGPLGGAFPIHRIVEWHARDASADGVMAPAAYERLHQQSRRIEAAFARSPAPLVPCHNDLLPGNVLFGAQRVWLLDFEYAGMNDVFFDLGNLSVNSDLKHDTDEQLLTIYFGQVTKARWARLQLMKMMSEFREGMWAVVQQAISTLDTDFVAYANERLANCERLTRKAEFETWITDAGGAVN
jgi:thiamine kinase-like enzyme